MTTTTSTTTTTTTTTATKGYYFYCYQAAECCCLTQHAFHNALFQAALKALLEAADRAAGPAERIVLLEALQKTAPATAKNSCPALASANNAPKRNR